MDATARKGCNRGVKQEVSMMDAVRLSPEHQVAIPQEVVQELHWEPGLELRMTVLDDVLQLVAVRDPRSLQGVMRGGPPFVREEDDRV